MAVRISQDISKKPSIWFRRLTWRAILPSVYFCDEYLSRFGSPTAVEGGLLVRFSSIAESCFVHRLSEVQRHSHP